MEPLMSDDFSPIFLADGIETKVRDHQSRIHDDQGRKQFYHVRRDQESAKNERRVLGKRETDSAENEEEKKSDIGEVPNEA
jgi:hypothetical protein